MSTIVSRADLKAYYTEDKAFVPLDHVLTDEDTDLTPVVKLLSLIYFDMTGATENMLDQAA